MSSSDHEDDYVDEETHHESFVLDQVSRLLPFVCLFLRLRTHAICSYFIIKQMRIQSLICARRNVAED